MSVSPEDLRAANATAQNVPAQVPASSEPPVSTFERKLQADVALEQQLAQSQMALAAMRLQLENAVRDLEAERQAHAQARLDLERFAPKFKIAPETKTKLWEELHILICFKIQYNSKNINVLAESFYHGICDHMENIPLGKLQRYDDVYAEIKRAVLVGIEAYNRKTQSNLTEQNCADFIQYIQGTYGVWWAGEYTVLTALRMPSSRTAQNSQPPSPLIPPASYTSNAPACERKDEQKDSPSQGATPSPAPYTTEYNRSQQRGATPRVSTNASASHRARRKQ